MYVECAKKRTYMHVKIPKRGKIVIWLRHTSNLDIFRNYYLRKKIHKEPNFTLELAGNNFREGQNLCENLDKFIDFIKLIYLAVSSKKLLFIAVLLQYQRDIRWRSLCL